ncbi:MAG: sigma-54-dependent Fis family transcriptional regulator [Deltaproteobacteria bacterium]|nr:sigma-54-dependent Fis family transcriptional regulator [Deltaproteobacteria bacterium]
MQPSILIADDEAAIVKALNRFLSEKGFQVCTAHNYETAVLQLSKQRFDLALIDLKLGDANGIDLLKKIKKEQVDTLCFLITGYGTIESAVEALKEGAYHYLTKPFLLEDVLHLLNQALETHHIKEENRILKQQVKLRFGIKNLVGVSDKMQEVYSLIEKVADTDSNILILGESGTGKELVARAIHYQSRRAGHPMVAVNCGAIPEDLLESELFGHIKGAFTGAVASRSGRFEMAQNGSVFLDEIGDMSLKLQVKLLRVIQERKFEPVGSTRTVEVDVRIIAATNKNLEQAVQDHSFREDLYYRLNVIPIYLPPLRERKSDVPLLAKYFFDRFAQENQRKKFTLSPEALDALTQYSWKGNVRELENVIERLVILKKEGVIEKEDLPEKITQHKTPSSFETVIPKEGIDLKKVVGEFENSIITKALAHSAGNKNKAAKLLKLNRTTLLEKIRKINN